MKPYGLSALVVLAMLSTNAALAPSASAYGEEDYYNFEADKGGSYTSTSSGDSKHGKPAGRRNRLESRSGTSAYGEEDYYNYDGDKSGSYTSTSSGDSIHGKPAGRKNRLESRSGGSAGNIGVRRDGRFETRPGDRTGKFKLKTR